MIHLGSKGRILTRLTLATIFVSAGIVFNWKMYQGIQKAVVSIEETNLKIASLEKQRSLAKSFKNLLLSHEADLARVKSFLIDKERPIKFIEDLEGLAKDTKNVLVINTGQTNEEKELTFNLTLNGTKESVFKYLRLVELMPYEIYIGDLLISRLHPLDIVPQTRESSSAASAAKLTLSLRVKTK